MFETCIVSALGTNLFTTLAVLLLPPLETTAAVTVAADTPQEQPEDKRPRRNFDVIASEESDDEGLLAPAIAYEKTFASHTQQQLQQHPQPHHSLEYAPRSQTQGSIVVSCAGGIGVPLLSACVHRLNLAKACRWHIHEGHLYEIDADALTAHALVDKSVPFPVHTRELESADPLCSRSSEQSSRTQLLRHVAGGHRL